MAFNLVTATVVSGAHNVKYRKIKFMGDIIWSEY
jgi:hypothetical protein